METVDLRNYFEECTPNHSKERERFDLLMTCEHSWNSESLQAHVTNMREDHVQLTGRLIARLHPMKMLTLQTSATRLDMCLS